MAGRLTHAQHLRHLGKRLIWRCFEIGQRLGIDVLPRHFYSQIPDLRALRSDAGWRLPTSMVGIRGADLEQQIHCARAWCPIALGNEVSAESVYAAAVDRGGQGPGFGPIEAGFLYCFVRTLKPGRIIQVGCGVSTAVMLHAALDAGYQPRILCIEPHPSSFLREAGAAGHIRLIAEKAERVASADLLELGRGDLLFVDSTHTVRPGGEVNRLIFEVLPRLPAGTYVHFHDVNFPYDYNRNLLDGDLFFWAEMSLLHAFLAQNDSWRIRVSLSMLHYAAPEVLKSLFVDFDAQESDHGLRKGSTGKHFPSSIYLERDAVGGIAGVPQG